MIDNPYRHVSRYVTLIISIIALGLACPSRVSAQDPVWDFIIAADSIYKDLGEEALAGFVGEHTVLVGAAVGQLVDAAVTVGDQGDAAGEKENLDFALLIGRIYADAGGPTVPMDLAGVYAGWSPQQRASRAEGKKLEEDAEALRGEKDFAGAEKALLDAIDIYKGIGDGYSEAVCWGSLGVVAWYAGDFELVFDYYRRALAARRAVDDSILEGRTLNGLGTANFVTGKFDSAEVYYGRAIDLRRRTGDKAGLGTSLTYLGNTYARMGRLSSARDSYEEAAVLVGDLGDPNQQMDLLNSAANLYVDMGRLGKANEAYGEALEIALSEGNVQYEMAFRMNIALNCVAEMRYPDAMRELDIVASLLEEQHDPVYFTELLKNRGIVYLKTGEFERARDDFLAFLEAAREIGDPVLETTAMVHIGYLYLELGAFDRGIAFADSALAKAEKLESAAIRNEALSLAAQLEEARGNLPEALEYWRTSVAVNSEAGAELWKIHAEIGVATVTALSGESESARRMFLDLLPRIREMGLDDYESNIWMGVAHSFEDTDPDSAKYYYERSLALIERVGMETGSAELGAGILAGSSRFYYEEVARYFAGMAEKTGDDAWSAEAFRIIERAKARGLLELLEQSISGDHSSVEDAVLDSIYALDPASADYSADLEKLEREYRRIRERRVSAATGNLSSTGDIVDISSVQAAIPRKTVMFNYALGDSSSLLWVIDREGYDMHELPGRNEIARQTGMLAEALVRPGAGDARIRSHARSLFRMLLGPGLERLEGAEHIVVIPDGYLFEIPFEALLEDDAEDGSDWADMPFVGRSRTVIYAPSASVFTGLREREMTERYDVDILAAGDPDYSFIGEGERTLRPLPNTRAEVEGIGGMFEEDRSVILVGAKASEAAVKRNIEVNPSRLIHLAAHGLVDPVTPAGSSIALASSPDDGEDGFLHTLEILSLNVESRLVVLSACETARGRVSRGEGVVGLSRAFLGAGASAVVSSLWAVPDESTSELMKTFYKYMVKKKKPAHEALREARKVLLESGEFSHPFHWASFILIGTEKAPN